MKKLAYVASATLLCICLTAGTTPPNDKLTAPKDADSSVRTSSAKSLETAKLRASAALVAPEAKVYMEEAAGKPEPHAGGDDCTTATVIPALPYSDTGNTATAFDDYDEICPFNTPGAPDVVYAYAPAGNETVDITLCGNSAYDTKLYVYENACGPYQSGVFVACNDDACTTPSFPNPYVSQLTGVSMTSGNTYYIIVDGYNGDAGSYTIDVTQGVPPPQCPPNTLFGQDPSTPSDAWTFGVADTDFALSVPPNMAGIKRWESFSGVGGPICDIHWWGIKAFNNGVQFLECTESPMNFQIEFFMDVGGLPAPMPACSYSVSLAGTPTGVFFSGFQMYEFSTNLMPCCTLTNGWVSIQGGGDDPFCWFLWASSGSDGDPGAASLIDLTNGTGITVETFDLSVCLTGEAIPGACCDDSIGICNEMVPPEACQGPDMRFLPGGTCNDFVPLCGQILGACCHPDGTCEITTQAECTDLWLGPNTTCDQCPCIVPCPPGGIPEQELCGDDDNGGCNSTPPVFEPINCGDTVCGTGFFDGSTRDTDWYELVITEDSILTVTLNAEFASLFGPIGQIVLGVPGCPNTTGSVDPAGFGQPCVPETVVTECVPAGTYYIFVAPVFGDLVFCPADYVLTVTCETCMVPRGACCTAGVCEDNLTQNACEAQDGTYQGDGTTCEFIECPQPPANDLCENAIGPLPVPSVTPGTTFLATIDGEYPNCPGASITSPGVWYTTIGTGNTMTASTCGPLFDYDTKISVYCGDCITSTGSDCCFSNGSPGCDTAECEATVCAVDPFCCNTTWDGVCAGEAADLCGDLCAVSGEVLCIGGNDDNCSGGASGLLSTVTWCSQMGAEYLILVHGFGGQTGDFELFLSDDGASCTGAVSCIPVGACCTCDGMESICTITTEVECDAMGGEYAGDDTDCGTFSYVQATGGAFEDITGTGISLALGDDAGQFVPIGFEFTFWGQPYTEVAVCSNGYLTFSPDDLTDLSEDAIPNANLPNNIIAALWDDLDPGNAGSPATIHYQTLGMAPDRRFIAQYTDVPEFPNTGANTFQVALFEGTNCVELRYVEITTTDFVAGVENPDGTAGTDVTASVAPGASIELCPFQSESPCLCLPLDIKPGSCPNSFNRGSNGVLPVGLLGTAEFDPEMVILDTVRLSRADGMGGEIAPHEGPPGPHSVITDVGTPFGGMLCDCHEMTGDGIDDLSMKFKTADLVAALMLNDLPAGALVQLNLTGQLMNGSVFIASDCVRLVPPGTPPGMVTVSSNAVGAWLGVSPLDLALDGGGFAAFQRTFPVGSVVTFTAEPTFAGRAFRGWEVDGVPVQNKTGRRSLRASPNTVLRLTLTADETAVRAIYDQTFSTFQPAIQLLQPSTNGL